MQYAEQHNAPGDDGLEIEPGADDDGRCVPLLGQEIPTPVRLTVAPAQPKEQEGLEQPIGNQQQLEQPQERLSQRESQACIIHHSNAAPQGEDHCDQGHDGDQEQW